MASPCNGVGHSPTSHLRRLFQVSQYTRPGTWLARISSAPSQQTLWLYRRMLADWGHLGSLALSVALRLWLFQRPNALFKISCFTVMVVGTSFVIGWLRFQTASLWPCVLLHATHNALLQTIFDPLTAATGKATYVTGEFGWGLAVTVAIAGFFLWRGLRTMKLEQPR